MCSPDARKPASAGRRTRLLFVLVVAAVVLAVAGLTALFVSLGLDAASKLSGILAAYLALISLLWPALAELRRRSARSPGGATSAATRVRSHPPTANAPVSESGPPAARASGAKPGTPTGASPRPRRARTSPSPTPDRLRIGGEETFERLLPRLMEVTDALRAILLGVASVFFGLFDLGDADLDRLGRVFRRIGRFAGTVLGTGLLVVIGLATGSLRVPFLLGVAVVAAGCWLLFARGVADLAVAGTALSLVAIMGGYVGVFLDIHGRESLGHGVWGVAMGLLTGGPVLTVAAQVRARWRRGTRVVRLPRNRP